MSTSAPKFRICSRTVKRQLRLLRPYCRRYSGITCRPTDDHGHQNKFDYGITAGAGIEFYLRPRHSIVLEARYYFGLGNIFPSTKADYFSASRASAIKSHSATTSASADNPYSRPHTSSLEIHLGSFRNHRNRYGCYENFRLFNRVVLMKCFS